MQLSRLLIWNVDCQKLGGLTSIEEEEGDTASEASSSLLSLASTVSSSDRSGSFFNNPSGGRGGGKKNNNNNTNNLCKTKLWPATGPRTNKYFYYYYNCYPNKTLTNPRLIRRRRYNERVFLVREIPAGQEKQALAWEVV